MSGAAIQVNYSISNNMLVRLYSYYSKHFFMFASIGQDEVVDSLIICGVRDLLKNEILPKKGWDSEYGLQDKATYQHNDYLFLMDEARHIWNSYYNICDQHLSDSDYVKDEYLTNWIIRTAIDHFVSKRTLGFIGSVVFFFDEEFVKKIVRNLPTVNHDYLMSIEQYLEYLVDKDIEERQNASK